MAHYMRMLASELVECCGLDGWQVKYLGGDGGLPPSRALIKKPGHASRTFTLAGVMSAKRVVAFCKSAQISAEKLAELRVRNTSTLHAASPVAVRKN
jgi:hypothetical protein